MKTTRTIVMIGTLGLLAVSALAQPAPGELPTPGPTPDRPGGDRPDPEMRRKMLLEKYDTNHDGKLEESELAAIGRDVEDGKFGPPPGQGRRGPNGPGNQAFNRAPRAQTPDDLGGDRSPAARGQRGPAPDYDQPPGQPGGRQQPFGRDGRRGDAFAPRPSPGRDGDGALERGGFAPNPGGPQSETRRKGMEAHRREIIKKYDAEGDGKLSPSEREALGRDFEEGKLPPPPISPPQGLRKPQPPRQPSPPQEPDQPREPKQPRPSE